MFQNTFLQFDEACAANFCNHHGGKTPLAANAEFRWHNGSKPSAYGDIWVRSVRNIEPDEEIIAEYTL